MRLQRGQPVAGLDPELARNVARLCHLTPGGAELVSERTCLTRSSAVEALEALTDTGFLEERPPQTTSDERRWQTTLAGGALTMASFNKPIRRATAKRLLDAAVQLARDYNRDPDKPLVVDELRVFGSYLDDATDDLGDVDLWLMFSGREGGVDPEAYARASGRRFSSIIDGLAWPETELRQLLRQRSAYLNVHTENIANVTDTWLTVYARPN